MKYTTAIRLLLLCAALSFVGMLRAQERHIDFTQVLSGVDGKPLQSPDAKNTKGLTLGEASIAALFAPLEEDKGIAGAEKFKLEELARKIYDSKNAHLTVEQI